jgi:hypothetical protein
VQDEIEILGDISSRFESAGIAFMLTGSMAMNYYTKDSHSEFQLRDVRNLLAGDCDTAYLENWTRQLDLTNLLEECQHE